jgi:hypothetical protein
MKILKEDNLYHIGRVDAYEEKELAEEFGVN